MPDDADSPEMRAGRHAIGLLQAARDIGDPTLIALAEATAMTAGIALADKLRAAGQTYDD